MDNEKFQELMLEHFGKVLKELSDVKESQTRMEADMTTMKSDIADLKESQARMQQDIIRIENDFGKKIDILFYDWRETQKAFNDEIRQELKVLSTKVEALQMESSKHDREIRELYLVNMAKNKKKE
ncbi:MAG: hypothetical protein GX958_06185 [Desulfitobacterium sp.]|nr:hypothetical protein [Desulfitobacterium sp.]